ncbi:MAG: HDIG domain-containing protein [Candidatus Coatesbacteria bacterium]|nr:MAG: HDIG domain-containing protein [Candidatus Coatesbacteria bacterium]
MKRLLAKIRRRRKKRIKARELRKRTLLTHPTWRRAYIFVGSVTILSVLITPGQILRKPKLVEGEIGEKDIIAPYRFPVYKDQSELRLGRKKAADKVLPVFERNETMEEIAADELRDFFDIISELAVTYRSLPSAERSAYVEELSIDMDDESLTFLFLSDDTERLENEALELQKTVFAEGVIDRETVRRKDLGDTVTLRDPRTHDEQITSVNSYLDEEKAGFRAEELAMQTPELSEEEAKAVAAVVRITIQPNVLFDETETERRREVARDAVDPVLKWVEENEKIVESHTRVTEEQILIVDALYSGRTKINLAYSYAGRTLLALIVFVLVLGFVYRYRRDLFERPGAWLLLAIILVGSVGVMRLTWLFLAARAPLSAYLLGAGLGAMLSPILLGPYVGFAVAASLSVYAGVMGGIELRPLIVTLAATLPSVYLVAKIRRRSDFYWVVVAMAVGASATIAGIGLIDIAPSDYVIANLLAAGGMSIMSVFIVAVVLPLFEYAFKITTDVRLLELGDLNQRLLKRLLVEAPGTHHHSILTANLAEMAAEAVGANPMLARVAAYYHDVGKLKSPKYFAENEGYDAHRHDHLTPQMSSLIIAAHTKNGAEIAEENRLPGEIVDVVREHHGTTLISFFYQEALKLDDHDILNESDFCYPGPKPRGKVSAIVMLADAVESASRSLEEVTSTSIRNLVERVVRNRLDDGQLDECDLTLKEISIVTESLIKGLTGVLHTRPTYPEKRAEDLTPPVLSISGGETKRD